MTEKILLGKSNSENIYLNTSMINRHGLIAGASGSGKTVTLKVIVEELSQQGIPLIIPDVKGDLFSLAKEGIMDENIEKRIKDLNLEDFNFTSFPVEIFDVFAENGIAMRTTISEMGPVLISRMLDLTEVQEGIMNIAFRIADEEGLLLIDIKDLRQILVYVNDNRKEIGKLYGSISTQSIGAIQRRLLVLEDAGGDKFFGETAFDIKDLFRQADDGRGQINILNAKKLIENPALYSSVLFWLLTKINQSLPESGDLDKPKLVFFFDEAHILFDKANDQTIDLIQRLVKSIRSKGVGIFFITQDPLDISDSVLSQLGNKIQHKLMAYTPKESRSVKAIAESFRTNENLDLFEEIKNLETGQAIVSSLDQTGSPSPAKKVTICPPKSFIGPVDDKFIMNLYEKSDLYSKYEEYFDRESAFEILTARIEKEDQARMAEIQRKEDEKVQKQREKEEEKLLKERQKQRAGLTRTAKQFSNSVVRSIGYRVGRDIYGMLTGKIKEKTEKNEKKNR